MQTVSNRANRVLSENESINYNYTYGLPNIWVQRCCFVQDHELLNEEKCELKINTIMSFAFVHLNPKGRIFLSILIGSNLE